MQDWILFDPTRGELESGVEGGDFGILDDGVTILIVRVDFRIAVIGWFGLTGESPC